MNMLYKKKHTPNNNAMHLVNSRYELLDKTRHKLYCSGDISTLFQGHCQTKLTIYKRAQIFIGRKRK